MVVVKATEPKSFSNTNHWAFKAPFPQPLPQTRATPWIRNPVDAFILSRLESEGLPPSREADRRVLIRRLKFDLLGLPPTPEETQAFIDDPDPNAFDHLVDRYLDLPQYGERWARHWLDVVRFAESNGFETNTPRPNSYPYRDYVIDAFNSDKPYDQFIIEQLAGDAIGADAATGFIVGGPWDEVKSPDVNLTMQQRMDELHDMVSTTSSAFLGLTVGCARCHDHKFDPIAQTDYYGIQAVFAGVQHGERVLRPKDYQERAKESEELQTKMAQVEKELAAFQPAIFPGRTLLLDDLPRTNSGGAAAFPLIEPTAHADYAPGSERGEMDDPGGESWLPNFGRSYSAWEKVANKDVFVWQPRLEGRFHLWLSWGCGWKTHATNAQYILDLDGDLVTTSDQHPLATINQQLFADGSGAVPNKPLWSGFYDAGVQEIRAESKVLLRAGPSDAWVSADVIAFQQAFEPPAESGQPALRGPVHPKLNVEQFAATEASGVRFTILETTGAEPCIDELEVWTAEETPRNIALASAGATATASGTFPNFELHKLEHINDGKVGNSRSWISNEPGKGWVEIRFAHPARVDRIVWGRDREEHYSDRLATKYKIEVLIESKSAEAAHPPVLPPNGPESNAADLKFKTVASSDDRFPYDPKRRASALFFAGRLDPQKRARFASLDKERRELEQQIKTLTTFPKVYAGRFEQPGPTYRLNRGEPQQKREQVTPRALSRIGTKLDLPAETPEQTRRLAFAKWIASPDNPLTARVIVNRLWQYHFGEGIVSTPSDFGVNGTRPSHPELLDWLALELIREKWSLKAIQRLILTSATYRQCSEMNPLAARKDMSNRLLWRFSPQRLEAEPLRDAILFVSGNLDLKMGGKGFDLFQPNENYVRVFNSRTNFGPAEWRRMIYSVKQRMRLDDTFGAFDCPDAGQIAPKRSASITPLQALNLLNSPFLVQQAGIFAERIERECKGSDFQREVTRAFELAFQRPPTPAELTAASGLVRQEGLATLCRTLLNANEFIYVF